MMTGYSHILEFSPLQFYTQYTMTYDIFTTNRNTVNVFCQYSLCKCIFERNEKNFADLLINLHLILYFFYLMAKLQPTFKIYIHLFFIDKFTTILY